MIFLLIALYIIGAKIANKSEYLKILHFFLNFLQYLQSISQNRNMDNRSSEIDTKTNYSLIKQYIFEEKPKVQSGKCTGGARTGYIVRDAELSKGNIGKERA